MISTKYVIPSLLLVTLVLSSLIIVSYAQQPNEELVKIGAKVRLYSVRGHATQRGTEDKPWINASMVLVGEITEVNRSRIRIEIREGNIKIGDGNYIVKSGVARVIFRKFGWMGIVGNATSPEGTTYKFHLEGMLHIERPGLVMVGLAGPFTSDKDNYILRLLTRSEKPT